MDPGSHVGFQISTKNTNLVELPSSEHFWQVWLKSVQRFQRRRFKCEKLTDGWTLTHDKSSHGLWPGELKILLVDLVTDSKGKKLEKTEWLY